MSVFQRYGIFPARIGDILFRQLGSASLSPANSVSEPTPGGSLDRSAVITAFADPMSRLQTTDIQSILATAPVPISLTAGYAFDTVGTPPGSAAPTASTLLQHQARLDGGTFDTAANHFTITSTKGYAHVDSISAVQDDVGGVKADISVYHLSPDGIAVPATAAANVALVSTPLFTALWYLGPVTLGVPGTAIWLKSVQSVTINTGLQYTVKRGDGHAFASIGSIVLRRPEIRIRLHDAEEWYAKMSPALFGLALTGALRVNCYLQKGLHGGTRVPYATAEHMNIFAATGAEHPENFSVAGEDDLGIELLIRPTGTLALANNVAIEAA